MAKKTRRQRSQPQRYKTVYDIRWGPVFTLDAGQEFTEADLLPGMGAALAKWQRVGAVVEVEDEKAGLVEEIETEVPPAIEDDAGGTKAGG